MGLSNQPPFFLLYHPQRILSTDTISAPREYFVFAFCTASNPFDRNFSQQHLCRGSPIHTMDMSRFHGSAPSLSPTFSPAPELPPSSSGLHEIAPLGDVWSPATKGPFFNHTGLVESSINGTQSLAGVGPYPTYILCRQTN